MKRILLSLLTLGLCFHMMANDDVHLKRLVQCVNDSDYNCALEELPLVEDWTYDVNNIIDFDDIENTMLFINHTESIGLDDSLVDNILLYITDECYYLTQYYYNIARYESAIDFAQWYCALSKTIYGEYSTTYAASLNNLGALYQTTGYYELAERFFLQALDTYEYVVGDKNSNYASVLNNLGVLYLDMGDYTNAEQYTMLSIRIYRELFGANHQDYVLSLINLGNIYFEMGAYARAETFYLQALEIQGFLWGENNPDYAMSCLSLGNIYTMMGNYEDAESYYLKTLEIQRIYFGENHLNYANTLLNLGNLYGAMGDYGRAEEKYLLALDIYRESHNENHITYAKILNNLANKCVELGDYQRAEKFFFQTKEVLMEIYGENHHEYAKYLNNIGRLYLYKGDYQQAKKYTLESLEIKQSVLGEDNLSYAETLENLGIIYYGLGDYVLAEKCLLSALEKKRVALGDDNLAYAKSLNQLGVLYYIMHDDSQAELFLFTAMMIRLGILGENHPSLAESFYNSGLLYYATGDYTSAKTYFAKAQNIYKNNFIWSLSFMSDNQRELYWNTMKVGYESTYPNFVYRYHYQTPSISSFAYDNELFTKGLLLNSSNAVTQSILESNDTTLIAQWNDLTTKKQQIIVLEQNDPQSKYLAQLRDEAEVLEKEITKSSAAYRENIRQWNITWDSVRNVLKPNQVAIEYMSVPLTDDSTMYCALLVRDTCTYPILIPLFNEPDVAGLLHTSTEDAAKINTTYLYDRNGKQLSQYIWSSVTPYIKPGEEVFFSPTGVLHQIAIENLPYDSTQTYGDVYSLVRLSSTRELVLNKPAAPHEKAVLYGGILYEPMMANKMLANAQRFRGMETELVVSMANDTTQRSLAGYLPGTKKEIDAIKPILENSHISVTVYSRDTACEESFKALSGTKQNMLLLATHGFFWQDKEAQKEQYFNRGMMQLDDEKPIITIDPLNRCGLLFAGANNALSGHFERLPEGVDDGILTAKEISVLDFRSTDIVVMSACETGLGDISGEGVFGLQRAFKMAGAQTILMTLWRVNDAATQLFMTSFFRDLNGHTKRQAFRLAQQEVRNYKAIEEREVVNHKPSKVGNPSETREKFKNKGKNISPQDEDTETVIETIVTHPYQSPYYWAGFILLD